MMQRTYQCKHCPNQVVSLMRPGICEVCHSKEWIVVDTATGDTERGTVMAIDKDIFSSSKFRSTIQKYCAEVGWKIYEISDRSATIKFTLDSGNTQTVFIIKYDNTLEFSCPSGLKFDNFDDIPHQISTLLLAENAKNKVCFWCIEKIGEKKVFSIMQNVEISLIDVKYFAWVVRALIRECDEFEQAIEKMLS